MKLLVFSIMASLAAAAGEQNFVIQTLAGGSGSGDNGPAVSALLIQVEGVAVDGRGNIYIADAGDNRVRRVSATGLIETVAGTGIAGFSGDGAAGKNAQLNHPYGLAFDWPGNLYIADLGNGRVRRVDTAGVITTVAGGGANAFSPGAPATSVKLQQPRNVAVDAEGTLYISDFAAHQVYRVPASGAMTLLAGSGKQGFSGDGGAAALAQFAYPAGIAADANGSVYVCDTGNARVRRVSRGVVTTIAANISSPTGLAVDASGHAYIASAAIANRIAVPSPAGVPVDALPGEDAAIDAAGTLFIGWSHYVRKLAGTSVSVVAGAGDPGSYGDGASAASAHLGAPAGIAVDSSGNLYIVDQVANRVRRVTPDGSISTILGTGDPAVLKSPSGVAAGSSGTIFIADSGNNRVRRVSRTGIASTLIDKLSSPACVRAAADGSVFVCDTGNDHVIKVNASGAASIVANVSKPAGIGIDASGALYVSSAGSVLKFDGPATAGIPVMEGLNGPAGLAFNAAGELFVAEAGKDRLLKMVAGGDVSALAADAILKSPSDVAFDAAGNLVAADTGNGRVVRLVPVSVAPAPIQSLSVVNAATLRAGAIAPGEILTIYGADIASAQVTFDGRPGTVFYAGPAQVNVLAPASLKPNSTTTITTIVNGFARGSATVPVVAAAPGVFTTAGGTGPAAALNEDGSVNAAANPAARGSIVVLFLTGDGGASSADLRIAGYPAEVLYAGPAPGLLGVMQVNARLPGGFLPSGALEAVVSLSGVSTQAGVTIAVQ